MRSPRHSRIAQMPNARLPQRSSAPRLTACARQASSPDCPLILGKGLGCKRTEPGVEMLLSLFREANHVAEHQERRCRQLRGPGKIFDCGQVDFLGGCCSPRDDGARCLVSQSCAAQAASSIAIPMSRHLDHNRCPARYQLAPVVFLFLVMPGAMPGEKDQRG